MRTTSRSSSTPRPSLTRRLLPALLVALGLLAGSGALKPTQAQIISGSYKDAGVGDSGDGSGTSFGSTICGYGKMQVCAQEATKVCSEWGVRTKLNITFTGFGIEYEPYCIQETTVTRWYYRDV